MSTYKPTEHDGLKQDGTPDKRTNPEHGFGGDRERASEMGQKGGATGGQSEGSDESYESSGNSGGGDGVPLKADGTPDKRYSSEHGFGGDRQKASEMGKAGGNQ